MGSMVREIGWSQKEIDLYNAYKKAQKYAYFGGGGSLPRLTTPALVALTITSSRIDLSWGAIVGAVSYELDYSLDGSIWVNIGGTISAGTLSYSHTGLSALTLYYYRLRAIANPTINRNSLYGTANATTTATVVFPHISNFTAPNGTLLQDYIPDQGNQWALAGDSTFAIQSNQLVPTLPAPAGNNWQAVVVTGPTQDYTVTVRIAVTDGAAYGAIYTRLGSGVGIYMLVLQNLLYGIDIAAGFTNFTSIAIPFSAVEREIKLVMHGAFIDIYADGVLYDVNRAINAANNGTACGMGQVNSPNVGSSINSFIVN